MQLVNFNRKRGLILVYRYRFAGMSGTVLFLMGRADKRKASEGSDMVVVVLETCTGEGGGGGGAALLTSAITF